MDAHRSFYLFLQQFVSFDEAVFDARIRPFFITRTYKKKGLISVAGEVEDFFNFVVKGLVRKYFRKESEEITTQIAIEGGLIYARESFHSRSASEYFIEAVEPTTIISCKREDLEALFAASPLMEKMGRLLVTGELLKSDRKHLDDLRLSPRERFLHFVATNPELLQRVPQKYLASLLNIQPETFSRFKHLLRIR